MSVKMLHKSTKQCGSCFFWMGTQRKVRYGMPSVIEYDNTERATCRDCGMARSGWHGGSCKKWQAWIR